MNAIITKKAVEISNDQIIEMAPAAGAEAPIAGVSDRYSFVPTIEAVNILRDTGWVPVSARQSSARKEERDGFQRHIIRFAMPDLDIGKERVDLVLYNSHDRGCAFKLAASVWRKICGNGLMVASELANYSHKHVGFSPDAFVESSKLIAGHAGMIAHDVDRMRTIELTPDERGVFASAAHLITSNNPERSPITPDKLLSERRYDDNGKDLWTTFNVVQENVTKGGLSGSVIRNGKKRRQSTRPVKSIERDVKLNHALWVLAERMAELKEAA